MKYIIIALTSLFLALAAPITSYGGNAPAWHLGSFKKVASLAACLSCAKTALAHEHCKIFNENSNTLVAGNDNVIAEVSCSTLPDGTTWVVVTAYSNDSALAEATRNGVREQIIGCHIID